MVRRRRPMYHLLPTGCAGSMTGRIWICGSGVRAPAPTLSAWAAVCPRVAVVCLRVAVAYLQVAVDCPPAEVACLRAVVACPRAAVVCLPAAAACLPAAAALPETLLSRQLLLFL